MLYGIEPQKLASGHQNKGRFRVLQYDARTITTCSRPEPMSAHFDHWSLLSLKYVLQEATKLGEANTFQIHNWKERNMLNISGNLYS
jgi:hypothetical protein